VAGQMQMDAIMTVRMADITAIRRCRSLVVKLKSTLFVAGFALGVVTGPATAQTFMGYDCTSDCSGHEAGYDWAESNDISDVSDCDGNSNSFNEGCEAYVEENDGGAAQSYDEDVEVDEE